MEPNKRRSLLFMALLSLLVLANLYLLMQVSPLIGKLFQFLKTVLLPFFVAVIISYVLHPIVTLLSSRMVPRAVAVLLIYATFIVSTFIILMNILPLLSQQFRELAENLPAWNDRLQSWIHRVLDGKSALPETIQHGLDDALQNMGDNVSESVELFMTSATGALSRVLVLLLIPFIAFYMLKDFKGVERYLLQLLPRKNRKNWFRLLRDIDEALGNYIRGQILVCVVVGGLAYVGYLLIGLPYAFLMAAIVALTNVIPYIGPYIGAAPAAVVGLSESWQLAVLVLVVNAIVQILEGNLVSPQIVGRTLKLHPLSIILALLVGGELAGIVGMIFAVPLLAVGKVIVSHIVLYYTEG